MSLDPILDHVAQAQANLLLQYANKPNILGLINAIVGPIQELEGMFQDLLNGRTIDNAVGILLDRLGAIVGQPRQGLDDDAYRIRIKIRIMQNVSQGEPDTLILVYQNLLSADLVFYQEAYPAGVMLMGDAPIPAGQETNIYENIQEVAAAGVRVDTIGTFDKVNPFCFAGGPIIGGGFGDMNDAGVGGKFASLAIPVDIKFSFVGSLKNQGFGDLRDPVMGGRFVSE